MISCSTEPTQISRLELVWNKKIKKKIDRKTKIIFFTTAARKISCDAQNVIFKRAFSTEDPIRFAILFLTSHYIVFDDKIERHGKGGMRPEKEEERFHRLRFYKGPLLVVARQLRGTRRSM